MQLACSCVASPHYVKVFFGDAVEELSFLTASRAEQWMPSIPSQLWLNNISIHTAEEQENLRLPVHGFL